MKNKLFLISLTWQLFIVGFNPIHWVHCCCYFMLLLFVDFIIYIHYHCCKLIFLANNQCTTPPHVKLIICYLDSSQKTSHHYELRYQKWINWESRNSWSLNEKSWFFFKYTRTKIEPKILWPDPKIFLNRDSNNYLML